MKKIKIFFIVFLGLLIACNSPENEHLNKTKWGKSSTTNAYINRYKHLAYEEMKRSKIPASISLAQAIVESDRGKSVLARTKNNHFGIRCSGKGCTGYARYKDVKHCWREHSKLLRNKRYRSLFQHGLTDYHRWAYELQRNGYAKDKRYAIKLIEMIEDYHLYLLDK